MFMSRKKLDRMLAQIRHLREETLKSLVDMTEDEFPYPTHMPRWTEVRRVLLRLGDHMREHANQIAGTRTAIERGPTMPQRILAESEIAWGLLLATTVGLSDDDLAGKPPDGSWSIEEILKHIARAEKDYLQAIREARQKQTDDRHLLNT
jgi:hypothetical protein